MVESEEFNTAPDRIDLADVARRAAGILAVRAQENGISIDAPKLGEHLPAIAEFRRVLQILLNLVGNAIRYSPEGGLIAPITVTEPVPPASVSTSAARSYKSASRLDR